MERCAFQTLSLVFVIVVCLIPPPTLVSKEEYGRASPWRFQILACVNLNLTVTAGHDALLDTRREPGAGGQTTGALL